MFWGNKILILPKSNQICPNLNHLCPNLHKFCPNLTKFHPNLTKFHPNLTKFAQISPILPKNFSLGDVAASSALTALAIMDQFLEER